MILRKWNAGPLADRQNPLSRVKAMSDARVATPEGEGRIRQSPPLAEPVRRDILGFLTGGQSAALAVACLAYESNLAQDLDTALVWLRHDRR